MSTTPTPTPGLQPVDPLVAQYNALIAAIGTGAKAIRFQDRTIEYNGTDEMIKAANWLYLKLASMGMLPGNAPPGGAPGYGTGVHRQIRMYTDKGL